MRLNELRLSPDERTALRAVEPARVAAVTQEALDREDTSRLTPLARLRDAGRYVAGRLANLEDHLRKATTGRTGSLRDRAREEALSARQELLQAVERTRERADEEEREEQIFRVEQSPGMQEPDFPVRVRLSFMWKDSASSAWRSGRIAYIYSPSHAPAAGGRRGAGGLTRRGVEAAKAERFVTLSAIRSVEDYLREKGTGEGIPEQVRIRDETLDNFSTALLPRRGTRQVEEE
ncbi:hypothetical protein [Muricoccus radiodurans]|uniref:hypothetical protein n=1 Tax=Muricoccus radiodurans TaxID=2231721 RepID=UPI003CF9E706